MIRPTPPSPRVGRLFRFATLMFAWLCVPGLASAQTLSLAETEDLVRNRYFEGMPEERAARIGRAGADRLVVMLSDPEEASSHAQILLALGLCGSPDARSAILGWAASLERLASSGRVGASRRLGVPRSIEVDRDAFKAWQALPYALGHTAKFDPRAVGDLERWLRAPASDWTFRQFNGPRLRDLARRSALTSLALTGLPEARQVLDRAGRDASDTRFEAHLRDARALHTERVRETMQ